MADVVKVGRVGMICTPLGQDVWVAHEPLCRGLRLDYFHWREVLRDPRECGRIDYRLSLDGRDGPLDGHVHYQSIPIWLQMVPASYLSHLQREDPVAYDAIQSVRIQGADAIRRHFFPASAPATQTALVTPGSLLSVEVLVAQALQHVQRQQQQIDGLDVRLRCAAELALRGVEMQTLGGRGQRFQVRTCCAYWKKPADLAFVNELGRQISDTAKREGWYDERHRDFDNEFPHVNSWPARRILRWFTDRFGPCPVAELRDLLEAEEGAA